MKVTEQLLWSREEATGTRTQVAGAKVPALELVKLTVPGGFTLFPAALEVSVTVAVQVTVLLTRTLAALQTTPVAVE